MRLYALSSGAAYTARAVARMGQLVLDRGRWEGQVIFDQAQLDRLLAGSRAPEVAKEPTPGGGWWQNTTSFLPTLPRDALVGFGGTAECVLVVPSLDLVVVRLGGPLEFMEGKDIFEVANERLFQPVIDSVVGSSSRTAQGELSPQMDIESVVP